MSYKVIGYEKREFDFQGQDGKQITGDGFRIHVVQPRQNVEGVACDTFFVSSQRLDGYAPALGDEIEFMYNRFGKISSVNLIKFGGGKHV